MGALITILGVLLFLTCVSLIGLILLQRGRGAGMVSFGGGGMEQAFGTRATTLAQKATVALGILFMLLTITMGLLYRHQLRATGEASPVAPQSLPAEEGAE